MKMMKAVFSQIIVLESVVEINAIVFLSPKQKSLGDRFVDAINEANTAFTLNYVCELSAVLCQSKFSLASLVPNQYWHR